jgi:hypothetical protein
MGKGSLSVGRALSLFELRSAEFSAVPLIPQESHRFPSSLIHHKHLEIESSRILLSNKIELALVREVEVYSSSIKGKQYLDCKKKGDSIHGKANRIFN